MADLDSVLCLWPGFGARRAVRALPSSVPKLIIGPAEDMADQAVFVCLFFYFT